MLHKKTVDPKTFEVLESLMESPILKNFYLTAGTALALRFGHRYSDDLDLWTSDSEFIISGANRKIVEQEVMRISQAKHVKNDPLRSVFAMNNVAKIDLILDQTPAIKPFEAIANIRFFSVEDIVALKIDATAGYKPRQNKKDFYDIYFLLQNNYFSFDQMLKNFYIREGEQNTFDTIKNFFYNMDLADSSPDPKLLNARFCWTEVKDFLKKTITKQIK